MKFSTTRPQTAELSVSIFARPLHPELFEVFERYEHSSESYQATISLTSLGHFIEFQSHGQIVTEVLDWKHSLLPRIKRLCSYTTEKARNLRYLLDSGIAVQLCFDCEYLSPDEFRNIQCEYWKQAGKATLVNTIPETEFEVSPPLSFLNVDPHKEAIGIHAFHLYPEECAIVKTQSLYQFKR